MRKISWQDHGTVVIGFEADASRFYRSALEAKAALYDKLMKKENLPGKKYIVCLLWYRGGGGLCM